MSYPLDLSQACLWKLGNTSLRARNARTAPAEPVHAAVDCGAYPLNRRSSEETGWRYRSIRC